MATTARSLNVTDDVDVDDDTIPNVVPHEATVDCDPWPSAYLCINSDTKFEIGSKSQLPAAGPQRGLCRRRSLLIGRQAATCDIRIAHKSLSRRHALLYYHKVGDSDSNDKKKNTNPSTTPMHPKLFLLDLSTKTGTQVNEQRIPAQTPVELTPGDAIQFGKAPEVFIVEWTGVTAADNKNKVDNNTTAAAATATAATATPNDDHVDTVPTSAETTTMTTTSPRDFSHLTGRERRKAEIEAMMASLDQAPTYQQYVPTQEEQAAEQQQQQERRQQSQSASSALLGTAAASSTAEMTLLEKHKLPLTEFTPITSVGNAAHSHLSSMVMDPTGSRFAIGNMDASLQLYDFAGYRQDVTSGDAIPFQNTFINAAGGGSGDSGGTYPVRSMAYSPTGDRLLLGLGSAQPQMMDRDGKEDLLTFVRGDVYVMDPTKTMGHTAAVTAVAWHPLEKSIVFSTSRDGSLRAWNVDHGKLSFGMLTCNGKDDAIVVKSIKTGRKTIPTCLAVASPNFVAFGTECGNLQIFKYPFVSKLRPQQAIAQVGGGTENDDVAVISLLYSVDGTKLATRTRRTIKVWNASSRPLSSSSTAWMQCLNLSPMDDDAADNSTPTMAFSPNARTLCVATTSHANEQQANVIEVYLVPSKEPKAKPSKPIYTCPIGGSGTTVTGLIWHAKLNQILVGTKSGFQIFYSDEWSKKGILLTASQRRIKKRRHGGNEDGLQELYASRAPPPGTVVREEEIIAPNALPLFGNEKYNKKRKKKRELEEEAAADLLAKHIPQKDPIAGGSGNQAGSIYSTSNTKFAQMIVDNQTDQKRIAGMDPREALAMYSEGKSYISAAYEGNVERILADKTVEEEEEDMKKKGK